MRKVTLRSIWNHKRRLVSTVVAVVLGVAFMSGTAVFADTLDKVFDDLFATVSEHVDARVQGEVLFSADQAGGDQRAKLEEDLLDEVRAVDGVAVAEPSITSLGFGANNRVLGADGDPVGASQGPPTLLSAWIDDELLNPWDPTDGSQPPEADDEIALNVAAAEEGELELGDDVTVATQFGRATYTLVGTFTFGDADSSAGAVSAAFTLAEAQRLAGVEGEVDSILVRADDGISQEDIAGSVRPILPDEAEVITGEQAAEQDASDVQEGFAFFQQALSIFGAIALLVGMFIIANTFQILVAQRTRELALLRAVGASRAQVLRSVLLEAVVIGVVSAALGVAAGVGLAAGITALLEASGSDLPAEGLVVTSTTVVTGLVIGLVVTVVSAVLPAIRATRVPPLAALRDVAFERKGATRTRAIFGALLLGFGAFNLAQAWSADGDTDAVPTVGLGALLLVVGAIVVGPLLAEPSIRLLGAALPRLRGVTGRLAAENAARSPKRTAATASALLIGVALIGFVTVFAASADESVTNEVERGLKADIIVMPEGGPFGGFTGFTPEVASAVGDVDGVDTVATFGAAPTQIAYPDGDTADSFIGAVDPATFAEVGTPRMEQGDFADLRPGGVLVDRQIADDNNLAIGDTVSLTFPGGNELELRIDGISDDLVVLAFWTMTLDDFDSAVDERLDFQVFATVDDGEDVATVLDRVEAAIQPFPAIEALDRDGFIGNLADQLRSFVIVIYALLFLSVIIALIGVGNTLSLSIHERTRELGLLRAVGMVRSQLRSSIRWEAALISVLGTVVGLGLGLVASYAMIKALEGFGLTSFALPIGSLAAWTIAFAVFGVLASLLAARRAAKLDVLQAIATE